MKKAVMLGLILLSFIPIFTYSLDTIHIKKDDPYFLELQANKADGFYWFLTSWSIESGIVEISELPLNPADPTDIQRWKITGYGDSGLAHAVFSYKQAGQPAIETKAYDFVVDKKYYFNY